VPDPTLPRRRNSVKLRVDRDWCQGHSRCIAAYPEWFDIDDDGIAVVKDDDLPADAHDRAHVAVANCPERAIHIVEESR
jgi:ferredoxin